jgi:hypothetical protein
MTVTNLAPRRRRGRPPSPDRPSCGTAAGYAQHRKRHEPPCRECLDAHSADERRRYPDRAPDPDRLEDYAFLRSQSAGQHEAAARAGVRDRHTIARYESAWQKQQRGEAAA